MRKTFNPKAVLTASLALSLIAALALGGCDASGTANGDPAADLSDADVKAAMQVLMEAEQDAMDGADAAADSSAPMAESIRMPSLYAANEPAPPDPEGKPIDMDPLTINEVIHGDAGGTLTIQGTYTFNFDGSCAFQGTNTYDAYATTGEDGTIAEVNGSEEMGYTSSFDFETGEITLDLSVKGTIGITHGGKTVPLDFDFGVLMTMGKKNTDLEYEITGTINGKPAADFGLEITVEDDTKEEPDFPTDAN